MKQLFISLFIFIPSVIFAQSNFHEGYVLKNNGDTLKGYIDYREWSQSPRLIDFKQNKTDRNVIRFSPQTVRKFQVAGHENYLAYTGMISQNRTNLSTMSLGLDTSKVLDTIFLKQVTTGSHLTLYYHSDDIKTRFFIAEVNSAPIELNYYEYMGNDNQLVKSEPFKRQLVLLLLKYTPGNVKLNNKIQESRYNETDLKSLIIDINGNDSSYLSNKPAKVKPGSSWFAGFGINSTKTQLNDDSRYIQTTEQYSILTLYHILHEKILRYSNSTSPKIDLGIDLFANPDVQQLIFRAEFSLSYISAKFQYPVFIEGSPIDSNVNLSYTFNQYTVRFTPQIIFNIYNKDDFKIYIDAGIGFNFATYTNNRVVYDNIITENPWNLEPYWTNFPLQLGIVVNKKFEFCLNFNAATTYTKYADFVLSNQSISGGFKYYLGGK